MNYYGTLHDDSPDVPALLARMPDPDMRVLLGWLVARVDHLEERLQGTLEVNELWDGS
jgi:hypothetical protein